MELAKKIVQYSRQDEGANESSTPTPADLVKQIDSYILILLDIIVCLPFSSPANLAVPITEDDQKMSN